MDERKKVLELVASGHLTVEEGDRLIEALDARPAEKTPHERFEPAGRFETPHDFAGHEIVGAISKAIAADTFGKLRNVRRVVKHRPGRVSRARTIDQIMSFASHGVDADYAREMKAVFDDISVDDLVSLSSMGVRPDYVEELKEAFGDDIAVHDIISLSSMGVKPDYVEEIKEAFGEIAPEDIISLSSMGVKAGYVATIRESLGDEVTVHDIIGLSSLGVSAKYIEDLVEAGVEGLSVDDVIRSTRDESPNVDA